MKPIVYIMRGLPGSGKSTWIRNNVPNAVVCSADHYFERNGKYDFDPKLLPQAHEACMNNFKKAILGYEDQIVVDNTNLSAWEYEKYVEFAKQNGYQVEIVNIGDGGLTDDELAARNTHGVPLSAYARMRQRMNS